MVKSEREKFLTNKKLLMGGAAVAVLAVAGYYFGETSLVLRNT